MAKDDQPKILNEMNGTDLEQFQMWMEYQKPMAMRLTQDVKGVWGTCGRCGERMVEILGLRDGKIVFGTGPAMWPLYCGKCGQRAQWYGEEG